MRLDKFLSEAGVATRREAARAAKKGGVTVGGEPVFDLSLHIDPEKAEVTYLGEAVVYRRYTYIMLNKPEGYISSTDDPRGKTVLELLDDRHKKLGLFPCGRLDRDTTGLLILTDDGETAHRLLSPRRHAKKIYAYECGRPLTGEDIARLEAGVTLDDGYTTLPAKVEADNPLSGRITLTEGKYHQIKRMFAAVGNHITSLERVAFGPIPLDPALGRGMWRYLTDGEAEELRGC